MLFKLSNLNSNLALTLGYLNPALNNSALVCVDSVSLKTMLNSPAGERFKKQAVSVSAHHCLVSYV